MHALDTTSTFAIHQRILTLPRAQLSCSLSFLYQLPQNGLQEDRYEIPEDHQTHERWQSYEMKRNRYW